jgi:hypothetical protein
MRLLQNILLSTLILLEVLIILLYNDLESDTALLLFVFRNRFVYILFYSFLFETKDITIFVNNKKKKKLPQRHMTKIRNVLLVITLVDKSLV